MKTLTQCKFKTTLLLALAVTSTYGGLSLAQDADTEAPITRMTYHDNAVKLKIQTAGYTLLGGSYKTSDQSISGGQDPAGKNYPGQTYDVSGSEGRTDFIVGRNGSKRVAEWFSGHIGASHNTFGHDPDKLNFAFLGDLTLSIQGPDLDPKEPVTFRDIALAQGHSGATNNWWFGGRHCALSDKANADEVVCYSVNYPLMKFTFARGNIDNFHSTPVDEVYIYIEKL